MGITSGSALRRRALRLRPGARRVPGAITRSRVDTAAHVDAVAPRSQRFPSASRVESGTPAWPLPMTITSKFIALLLAATVGRCTAPTASTAACARDRTTGAPRHVRARRIFGNRRLVGATVRSNPEMWRGAARARALLMFMPALVPPPESARSLRLPMNESNRELGHRARRAPFPRYEQLPDHTGTPRRLSELQGDDLIGLLPSLPRAVRVLTLEFEQLCGQRSIALPRVRRTPCRYRIR
jgi:hypothetical protein